MPSSLQQTSRCPFGFRQAAPDGPGQFAIKAAGFNRPLTVRFGPDECAYVVDYGAVRDVGADTHFVGANNGPLLQIPGTGVIFKICKS